MEIYLDNSATTKPYQEVVDKMVYALTTDYANPSSLHRKGIEVEKNLLKIRKDKKVEKEINSDVTRIYLNAGKKKKIRVIDIVGTISNLDGINKST